MSFWQEIPFVRLTYRYQCQEELHLPPYKGSALRGAFGHALKRVTCALRRASCSDCLLRQSCVYVYVFETPPPEDSRRLRLYPAAPHPFVLRPPADQKEAFAPGEMLWGELILIGRAMEYLPYFVYALEVLGQEGLGRGRGRAELEEVVELDGTGRPGGRVYSRASGRLSTPAQTAWVQTREKARGGPGQATEVEMELLTPVRLKAGGRYVERLEFHHVIRNLLRRLASLAYFHSGIDPEAFDFRGAIREAERVASDGGRLHWQDWERYSGRQGRRLLMGGLVGRIKFKEVPPEFWGLLATGEQLHVGKLASFGLGRYGVGIKNQNQGAV